MIAIYGAGEAGGHVLDIIRRNDPDQEIVFVDDEAELNETEMRGCRVIGGAEELERRADEIDGAVPAFAGKKGVRLRLAERIREAGVDFVSVRDASVIASETATIGEGVVLSPQSNIGPNVTIEAVSFLHGSVNISHDSSLGRGVTVGPGVTIAGGTTVEADAYIGAGATIVDHVTIGSGATIGAGSVVIDDVDPDETVAGVPAEPI